MSEKNTDMIRHIRHLILLSGLGVLAAIMTISVHFLTPEPVIKPKEDKKEKVDTSQYPDVTIVLDPGHGGYDSGTIGYSETKEKDLTLTYTLAIGERLKALNPNLNIVYTRDSDEIPWEEDEEKDLIARVDIAKENKADYFLSIHVNANANDLEATDYDFFVRQDDKVSQTIAQSIIDNLQKNGWDYESFILDVADYPLYVVSDQDIPAMLYEIGYFSNPDMEQVLLKDETVDLIADAVAQAYHQYILEHDEKSK